MGTRIRTVQYIGMGLPGPWRQRIEHVFAPIRHPSGHFGEHQLDVLDSGTGGLGVMAEGQGSFQGWDTSREIWISVYGQ